MADQFRGKLGMPVDESQDALEITCAADAAHDARRLEGDLLQAKLDGGKKPQGHDRTQGAHQFDGAQEGWRGPRCLKNDVIALPGVEIAIVLAAVLGGHHVGQLTGAQVQGLLPAGYDDVEQLDMPTALQDLEREETGETDGPTAQYEDLFPVEIVGDEVFVDTGTVIQRDSFDPSQITPV